LTFSPALAVDGAVTRLAEPLAGPALRARARRGKEDPLRIGERLGRASVARPAGPLAWLHGVSVGESQSLLPLAEVFREGRPDATVLMTTGTRTAAELIARRAPEGVLHQYAPVDAPGAVARFLDHWQPELGVFVESELWPNLIGEAQARGVKLALVSARMTEKSARGWRRTPAAARRLLQAFSLVLPQDAGTEARLRMLGAATGSRLNLKRVGAPLPFAADELAALRAGLQGRPVVLAASTHPGEDELVLGAFRSLPNAVLAICPRHPERGSQVADLAAARGYAVARRSLGQPLDAKTEVYVADTLGEMGLFYRLAEVVVMGGGFAPGVGGHNPLEAARLGRPVLTGAEVFNAAEIYGEMFERVAALRTPTAEALARDLRGLLADPLAARRIGEAGLTYAEAQGGALENAMTKLLPMLPR
jgi:3-deoxy-D-manno-octulosonic-acid transferase